MKLKIKIVLFLILLFLFISMFKSTYARYASMATGQVSTPIASWQVLVNNTDITSNTHNSVSLTPNVVQDTNVKNGKIAPGSMAYVDIAINPQKVETSYTTTIVFDTQVDNLTSFHPVKYGISNGNSYASGTTEYNLNSTSSGWQVSNSSGDQYYSFQKTFIYNNSVSNFKYSNYVLRVYFLWDNQTSGAVTGDRFDTEQGLNAASGDDTTNNVGVEISFEQYVGA